ncbi:hypothetical protein ACFPMF_15110 [Larkinella bovis]|uniref:Lipoprotein n=1 Tax=Larkinella bovis TaxID=683041 RepID=A0ABW0IAX8_9BACT
MNRIVSNWFFLLSGLFFGLYFTACTPDRNQNTKELAQEMNDRKIKRVTDAQLTTTVDEWGKSLVQTARKALTTELQKNTGDTARCSVGNLPVIQKLAKKYAVTIDLLSAKDTANPVLNTKEQELLAAYFYNAQNNLEQNDNIQKLSDTLFVYNAPVAPDDLICKTCSDQATPPFVVWRVVFKKREVIRRIDPKKLQ